LKIIHVVHSYFPKIGGIERAVQYLAEEQARLGHDVTVITSNIDVADSPKEETINEVKVVRLKSRRPLYNDLTIPLEEPPIKDVDIIHAHSQNSLFSIIVAERLKAKGGGKVAFHFMAVEVFKSHPNFLIRLLAPYYGRRNTRKALKLADIPLVRSIRDLEILRRRYGVEAQYLPDAVPEHYFIAEKADPNEFREKFGIKQKKFFLYVGRMHKLKGPHVLVEAMKHVGKDYAAVFIGPDGGYLEKTLSLARRLGRRGQDLLLGLRDERNEDRGL
jgi:glycosyltransferase involved in cell wall biosynthesis